MKPTISVASLKRMDACLAAVEEFSSIFGIDEVEVNAENAVKVVNESSLGANAGWLVSYLLTKEGMAEWEHITADTRHHGTYQGCPGCLQEMLAFVRLYEKEEYRKKC